MKHSQDEIASSDHPWSSEKIRILLEGEALALFTDETGRQYEDIKEGMTLFEMRCKALDGGDPELILEPAQFDAAARGIRDQNVRAVLLLRSHCGADADTIGFILGDRRAGYHMVRKGIDLVRRQERTRHTRRVLAGRVGTKIVCWRCLDVEVTRAGEHCGCEPKEHGKPGPKPGGPGGAYDPTLRPDPATMTQAEKDAEIAKIVEGQVTTIMPNDQERIEVPGYSHYEEIVKPYGGSADVHRALKTRTPAWNHKN